MKQRIISAGLAAALVLAAAFPTFGASSEEKLPEYNGNQAQTAQYADTAEQLASMSIAAEDDKAVLYFDPDTANIALKNKADSSLWFSAPLSKEGYASAAAAQKGLMSSAVILSYTDSSLQQYTLSSFADCAAYGQIKHEKTDSGVNFTMTLGKLAASEVVPEVLTGESAERLEEELSESDYKYVIRSYREVTLKGDSTDNALLTDYPALKEGIKVYALRTNTGESVKKKLAGYFAEAGYTREDLEADELTVYGKLKNEAEQTAAFTLQLNYSLENGQLKVSVPIGDIIYDEKEFKLVDIELLRYFGADGFNDSGFFLIPDGSGAVSEYKAGQLGSGSPLTVELYGDDASYQYDSSNEFKQNGLIPVYGQQSGGKGYIAIVESGDAQAAVSSVIDESETSLRFTRFICRVRLSAKYTHSEQASHNEYIKSTYNGYEGDYTVRYIPLADSSYSGMASTYREYLTDNGVLQKRASDKSGIHIELLGAVESKKNGIVSDTATYALTTFDDASDIINELKALGELSVSLKGWANGGIDHTVFSKIKVMSELGGKKGLKNLIADANKAGASVYPQVDISYAYTNKYFDGFTPSSNAAHQLDNSYARIYPYNLGSSLGNYEKLYHAVKSSSMIKYNTKLLKAYNFGATGISYDSIGSVINSDSSKKSGSRTDALNDYIKIMEASGKKLSLELSGGNQYIWKYAAAVRQLPAESSKYRNADISVPFVQMLLHGFVPYSSNALNLSGDTEYYFLKAMENGEQLSYTLAYRNLDKLALSQHSEYNSVDYAYLSDIISENAARAEKILGGTYDKVMTEHKYLTEDVVSVTYENGITVIVNYSEADYSYNGTTVPARDAVQIKQ